jgi:hypothetical protein
VTTENQAAGNRAKEREDWKDRPDSSGLIFPDHVCMHCAQARNKGDRTGATRNKKQT